MSQPYYQVAVASGHDGCFACKQGRFWTVIYFLDGEDEGTEIGTSWADEETAQDVCDLMNMAYDAGTESGARTADQGKPL